VAEGVGFEPTVLAYNGFQDRLFRPLRHPSIKLKHAFLHVIFCLGHNLVRIGMIYVTWFRNRLITFNVAVKP
jgi:hypothetical protein